MRPQTVTDEEILMKARDVFIRLGYSAPVSAIAQELGLSQPALFKRFGTKKNLFIEAMRPPKEILWMDIAEQGPDDRPFREQFEELLEELIRFFKTIGPVIQVVKMSSISPREIFRDGEEPIPVRALRVMISWLEKCQDAGLMRTVESRFVAMSVLGACQMDTMLGAIFEQNKVNRGVIANNREAFVDFYMRALEKEKE